MLDAIDRAGVTLQIGFMRRFDAGFVAAKQRVDAGEIGRVVSVKSLTHGPTIPKPWMYDIRKSNGPLSEVNSHDIDTVRWLSGSEFDEVYAIAGNYRSPAAREQFPDFYDNVILSARLRNGMQGCICGAQGVLYGYDARCEILGEKGLITVGSLAADTVAAHTAARQHECDRAQLAAIVSRRVSRRGRRLRALRARTTPAPRRRAGRQGGRDGRQCRQPVHRPAASGVLKNASECESGSARQKEPAVHDRSDADAGCDLHAGGQHSRSRRSRGR